MPTSEQFYAAKADVAEHLETLAQVAGDVERVRGETGFVGALLQTILDDGITQASELKRQAIQVGEQLLTELQRRAETCEQYEASLRSWQTRRSRAVDDVALAEIGPRPMPPYPWVET